MKKPESLGLAYRLISIVIAAFLSLSSPVQADSTIPKKLVKAVDKALQSRGNTDIKVFSHDFRIQSIPKRNKVKLADNRVVIVSGVISHKIKLRKDDQLYYQIIIEDKKVRDAQIMKIERGGILRSAGMLDMIFGYSEDNLIDKLSRAVRKNKWESVASYIIGVIAHRTIVTENFANSSPPPRSGNSSPGHTKTGSTKIYKTYKKGNTAVRDHRKPSKDGTGAKTPVTGNRVPYGVATSPSITGTSSKRQVRTSIAAKDKWKKARDGGVLIQQANGNKIYITAKKKVIIKNASGKVLRSSKFVKWSWGSNTSSKIQAFTSKSSRSRLRSAKLYLVSQ